MVKVWVLSVHGGTLWLLAANGWWFGWSVIGEQGEIYYPSLDNESNC